MTSREGCPRSDGKKPSPPRHWRVFYTRARAEKKCEKRLEEACVEVLLPKIETRRRWKDRTTTVVEPLFRNYIFACVDEAERIRVLRTPGIVRCVVFDGQPAIVPEEEVEQLRILQRAPGRLALASLLPDIGEKVTVDEGPLQGLTGRVLEYRGQMSLLVRVDSVRQAVKVHVPAEWVSHQENATSY